MAFELRVLAVVLALAFQAQATVPFGESGLRLAVSDLFLPIALLYAAAGWRYPNMRPHWRSPGLHWWLLGIAAVMSVALVNGYVQRGEWSTWAVVNKWGGWFALAGYFLVGGSITAGGGLALREEFLRVFLGAAAAIAALNALAMPWLFKYYTLPFGIEFNRATGGMQNANAFGFLLVVAILLVVAMQHRVSLCLPPLLTALWFTSSRGSVLALAAGVLVLLAISPKRLLSAVKPSAVAIAAVVMISTASVLFDPVRLAQAETGANPIGFFSIERVDPEAETIEQRKEQNGQAIALFSRAPLLGYGLGYFIATTGYTLHNSLLWLVLETGLLGAVVFVSFLVLCLYQLYLGREDPFLLGMAAVAAAFMAMSLTGEFLYQRHLWFLLGMALASPQMKPQTKLQAKPVPQ